MVCPGRAERVVLVIDWLAMSGGFCRPPRGPETAVRGQYSAIFCTILNMRPISICLLAIWLCCLATPASALPTAPLQVLNTYIEGSGRCSENLVEWNRKYNARTVAGEVSRIFYYRAIALQEWGPCGRPYFKKVFSELQKIWLIFAKGIVTEAEITAKEAEVINLLFSALAAGSEGGQMVEHYEQQTNWRLMNLEPERHYFNCTFFADKPYCTD